MRVFNSLVICFFYIIFVNTIPSNADDTVGIKSFPIRNFCSNVGNNILNAEPYEPWVWGPFDREVVFRELCENYQQFQGGMRGNIKDLLSFEKITEDHFEAKGNDTAGCTFVFTYLADNYNTVISCPKSPEQLAIERQTQVMCEAQKATCIASCPRFEDTNIPDGVCENQCKSVSCN